MNTLTYASVATTLVTLFCGCGGSGEGLDSNDNSNTSQSGSVLTADFNSIQSNVEDDTVLSFTVREQGKQS